MQLDRKTVYTNADGTPIEGRPDPLPADSSTQEWIERERAWHRYLERVAESCRKTPSKKKAAKKKSKKVGKAYVRAEHCETDEPS